MAGDVYQASLDLHERNRGKLSVANKMPIETKEDLSLAYTPGVAEPCRRIAKVPGDVYRYTNKGNTVCVLSDGSKVLGLGNLGAAAAIPVMEGKCCLFKRFANLDAWPICVRTQEPEEIIMIARNIAPVFGGINLEDITAPSCFVVEEALQDIGIPVMHDDQHGTAVVILASLINAAKVVGKDCHKLDIVISGAGAAGIAATIMLQEYGVGNVLLCDTTGPLFAGRAKNMNAYKEDIARKTNRKGIKGTLADALKGADVFIGVSAPNLLGPDHIRSMAAQAIVFGLSNPVPEIMPEEAKAGGAAVVATGRSDYPNQVNNALAFPGIFRGAIDGRAPRVTMKMKFAAAQALADAVPSPTVDRIIPSPFEAGIHEKVARAVQNSALH